MSRFVYTSSCSVYGAADQEIVDEESPLHPQTAYAECKQLVERDVAVLADDGFTPTFLRNATACGASPRLRFDVVLNNLCGLAWTTKEIRMESDGTPWRPIVHVLDICQAIALHARGAASIACTTRSSTWETRMATTGSVEIAEIVGGVFPGCTVTVAGRSPDARSYRVSFAKIQEVLPELRLRMERRAKRAPAPRRVRLAVSLSEEDFRSRDYTRLKQIEHLLASRRDRRKLLLDPRPAGGRRRDDRYGTCRPPLDVISTLERSVVGARRRGSAQAVRGSCVEAG